MTSFKDYVKLGEKYVVKYKRDSDRAFNQLTVDDNQFLQAYRYLQTSEESVNAALKNMTSVGLGSEAAEEILAIIRRYDNPGLCLDIINHPTAKITMGELVRQENIIAYLHTYYGLDQELLQDLLAFSHSTQPVTGQIEAFMCLFVRGARKGAEKGMAKKGGDIFISGKNYEIKGSGGRLRGTTGGYGGGAAVARQFYLELDKLAKKAKIELPPKFKGGVYSINSKNHLVDEIAPVLIQTHKISKENIVEVYANALLEFYERSNVGEMTSWIKNCINLDGTIALEAFQREHFLFAMRYYAKTEKFDYFVAVGTNDKLRYGKIACLSYQDIMNGRGVGNVIGSANAPAYKSNASAWDPAWAIRLGVSVEE